MQRRERQVLQDVPLDLRHVRLPHPKPCDAAAPTRARKPKNDSRWLGCAAACPDASRACAICMRAKSARPSYRGARDAHTSNPYCHIKAHTRPQAALPGWAGGRAAHAVHARGRKPARPQRSGTCCCAAPSAVRRRRPHRALSRPRAAISHAPC
jgi:hypothetical protein